MALSTLARSFSGNGDAIVCSILMWRACVSDRRSGREDAVCSCAELQEASKFMTACAGLGPWSMSSWKFESPIALSAVWSFSFSGVTCGAEGRRGALCCLAWAGGRSGWGGGAVKRGSMSNGCFLFDWVKHQVDCYRCPDKDSCDMRGDDCSWGERNDSGYQCSDGDRSN